MDYFETTYQDLFPIFSKEGYFLCRGVFPTGVTNLSWRNHFKYTWNWHSCLKILQISFSQLSFVTIARVYETTLHHLKQKVRKKRIEQWSDTIHTSIKTDFHSWFIYYLVLKKLQSTSQHLLKSTMGKDLRNRQNNNKLEHVIYPMRIDGSTLFSFGGGCNIFGFISIFSAIYSSAW